MLIFSRIFSKDADFNDKSYCAKRKATIKGDNGETLFEQDVLAPESWSQLAVNIVASKYFYGEQGSKQRENSVMQMVDRVVDAITQWGIQDGYFDKANAEIFHDELKFLCLNQYAAFNSPVWFNVGLFEKYGVKGDPCGYHWDEKSKQAVLTENPYEYPQASACFIQSVDDNMDSIMELAKNEAMLFKYGSGTGTDLSKIRSQKEKLSGGGTPSGPLSFMRVYDQIAGVVKSGGKTRRAAKMQSIKDTHPDILEFIECKYREEEKARALVAAGYSTDEAYATVPYQNANLSVRLSDDFMKAVENDKNWRTKFVTDNTKDGPVYLAKDIFRRIAGCTWACGDPGVQFDTRINEWHTCPNSGRINASNPCSEYMFLDDSACNLASINLMKFRDRDGSFMSSDFLYACHFMLIAQDILVDHASYPTKKIAENSHSFRPLGLGYSNLGAYLMSVGIPYNSITGHDIAERITAIMTTRAYITSYKLAKVLRPFSNFENNKHEIKSVLLKHLNRSKYTEILSENLEIELFEYFSNMLETRRFDRHGIRNAQVTVLAPTGTISFMMDCDTTGIEPDIALVKFKHLVGGGTIKMVNRSVPLGLKSLGYSEDEIKNICQYIEENRYIEGAPGLKECDLPVFDCAFPAPGGSRRCIPWKGHIKMMAAVQPFISGAISKTVNMPNNATVEDIEEAYMTAWKLGLKAVAIYRDGSKTAQPLSTGDSKNTDDKPVEPKRSEPLEEKTKTKVASKPKRERMPDTRDAVTHKFNVAGHEGYVTVGRYPDGRVGEIFISMAKEGSTIGGLMDCFSTSVSMGLQYGVPLKSFVQKFSHMRFEPMGYTKNPDVPVAKSLIDYIFRWVSMKFLNETVEVPNYHESTQFGEIVKSKTPKQKKDDTIEKPDDLYAEFQEDAPVCDSCGAICVRSGNCYLCYNCGKSMGCS